MKRNIWTGIWIMIMLVMSGCGSPDSGGVAVRYDGGSLTLADLAAHREKMKKDSRFRQNPEQITPQFVLEHAVNMEMIIAKGLKENLHLDPRTRAEIHYFMAGLFLEIMKETLVPRIDKNAFSEAELRAYFDAHPESYSIPATYDLYVIRAEGRDTLEEAQARITGGEMSFEAAARVYSTDESSRKKGGSVGKRVLPGFRPALRETVEGLETRKITGPIELGGHWYLLRLAGKTAPVPYDFEKKKAYVRNDLLYAKYRDAWRETYEKLKQEFSLQINETTVEKFLAEEESQ